MGSLNDGQPWTPAQVANDSDNAYGTLRMNDDSSSKPTRTTNARQPRRVPWRLISLAAIILISGLGMAVNPNPAHENDPQLILWYRFDGAAQVVSANDSSDRLNHGAMTNFPANPYRDGVRGLALLFDGGDDRIEVSGTNESQFDFTGGNFTLHAWVNQTSYSGTDNIIDKGNSGAGDPRAYRLQTNGSRPSFCLDTSAGGETCITGAFDFQANVWYMVTATYDGFSARLYVNGTEAASVAKEGTIDASNLAPTIGRKTSAGSELYGGLMDDLRVYNATLPQARIQAIYNETMNVIPTVTVTVTTTAFADNGDLARQFTLNQVWAAVNATDADVLSTRNILWNELNQSAARQSLFWDDYNVTEAAHLAETLQARNILWNELNQSAARQSLFWDDYNVTEDANLNKILTSLAATEANLTTLHGYTFGYLHDFEARLNATLANLALANDAAHQSTLLQVWDQLNQTIVTETVSVTSTATITTTEVAAPTTQFINDTRSWESHVYSGNLTDNSAAGQQLLEPQPFTITKPYDMALVSRRAILSGDLNALENDTATAFKSWMVRVDNSTLPGCIFKANGIAPIVGATHQAISYAWNFQCTADALPDGAHNVSIWRQNVAGGGLILNATDLHLVLRFTDVISWPSVQGVFIQPVLTPILITVPQIVNITQFVPIPTPTYITVTAFLGNASDIIEATSMQFGGLDSNASWTIILYAAVFILGLWRGWWFLAGTGLVGILGVVVTETGNDWPLSFAGNLLLILLGFVISTLTETRMKLRQARGDTEEGSEAKA